MKTQQTIMRITRKASRAILANRFVTFAGVTAAAGANAAGPAYFKAAVNEHFSVTVLGAAPAVAGGAIVNGAELEVGNDGKVVTKNAGKTVARALEAAAADGDELSVFVIPN